MTDHSPSCYCETCFQLQAHRDAAAEAELEASVPDDTVRNSATIFGVGDSWQLTKNSPSMQLTNLSLKDAASLAREVNEKSPLLEADSTMKITLANGWTSEWSKDGFVTRDEKGMVRIACGNIDELKAEASKRSAADFIADHSIRNLAVKSVGFAKGFGIGVTSDATKQYISIDPDKKLENIRQLMSQEFLDRAERPGCTDSECEALAAMRDQLTSIFNFLEKTK